MKLNNKDLIGILGFFSALLLIAALKGKTVMENVVKKVWDWRSEEKIETLNPAIKNQVRIVINELQEQENIKIRVTAGARSFDRQNTLFAQNKSNAQAGQSYHNYGLAVDVVEISPYYGFSSDYDTKRWEIIAKAFKKYGFEWGGDWKSFIDKPHFQKTFGFHHTQLLAMYNNGNTDANGNLILS